MTWYPSAVILTNLDVSGPEQAAAVEHWYRHRTSVETSSATASTAPRCATCPAGYQQVNTAWMWGALLAAGIAGWLHHLTGVIAGPDLIAGHGIRDGKAMIATLRRRLITFPARLIRHAGRLVLRPAPGGHELLDRILTTLRALPNPLTPATDPTRCRAPSFAHHLVPGPTVPDPQAPPLSGVTQRPGC